MCVCVCVCVHWSNSIVFSFSSPSFPGIRPVAITTQIWLHHYHTDTHTHTHTLTHTHTKHTLYDRLDRGKVGLMERKPKGSTRCSLPIPVCVYVCVCVCVRVHVRICVCMCLSVCAQIMTPCCPSAQGRLFPVLKPLEHKV